MNWEEQLISLYLLICKSYKANLWSVCQRFTNGKHLEFSDEEVLVIYIYGLQQGLRTKKDIHRYAIRHLAHWFPCLPNYPAFNHRVNRLHDAFSSLVEQLQSSKVSSDDKRVYIADSLPIYLAQHQHAYRANVAPELASKSYNATKKMYYYGLRAHVVARYNLGQLPEIEVFMLEGARHQDGPSFDQIRPMLRDNLLFADKAYKRPDADVIEMQQDLKVITPVIKPAKQPLSDQQRLFSKKVSKIRQPIEALFAWLQRVTGIQQAGLVRSTAGLLTHIFGRLAAAMLWK